MDYDRPKKASCCRVRLIIAILATFCPIVCYISRQNLSMAIVSMVEDGSGKLTLTNNNNNNNINNTDASLLNDLDKQLNATNNHHNQLFTEDTSCPVELITDERGQKTRIIQSFGPKYEWDSGARSFLLSSFFWTYVIFQIPAARVAERLGAKWILLTAAAGSALLSLVSPCAASMHVYALAAVRILMGVCQTALYPACYVLYSKWLPPVERSLALPILYVGAYVGSMIATSLTGYFSEQEQFGWEWAFYVPGIVCAIWSLFWFWLAANEPREHKSISLEEIQYIESRMETQSLPNSSSSKKEIDWWKLIKSRAIWAMIAAFIASNWSFTIVLLLIPSYLNDIQHIPPFKNGLINTTIYALYCISAPLSGSGSTMMVETRAFGLTRLHVRKLFQCVAIFGSATCFIALTLIGCNQTLVLAALFTLIILFSFTNGGEVHLPTELSVDFAGTIYAIGNCLGSATSVIAPILHSVIVPNVYNRAQWDMFFYVAALICALGGLIFIFFGDNQLTDFSKDLGESQLDIFEPTKGASSFSLASVKQQQTTQIKPKRKAPEPPERRESAGCGGGPTTAALRSAWMETAIQQHGDHSRGSVQNS